MASLTLDQARTIVEAARRRGRELALAPLTVAVLDAGGHLVALEREDRSGILRAEIAFGKAWGALGMGFGSRELWARSEKTPAFIAAIGMASGGRVVPAPGGVLIENEAGEVLGAVGISGDVSAKDESCAVAGIEAAGLKPRAGA
ncbi:MAG: heme-binding protein [Rhodospirillales bacterium]|nr:heme-binding protein [Rhodospirillales bacterium]